MIGMAPNRTDQKFKKVLNDYVSLRFIITKYSGTSLQRTCFIRDTSQQQTLFLRTDGIMFIVSLKTSLERTEIADTYLQRTPFLGTNSQISIEIYLFIGNTSLQRTPFSRINGVHYLEVPLYQGLIISLISTFCHSAVQEADRRLREHVGIREGDLSDGGNGGGGCGFRSYSNGVYGE